MKRALFDADMRLCGCSELLQTGMVAGAVVLVLSIGMSRAGDSAAFILTTNTHFYLDSW